MVLVWVSHRLSESWNTRFTRCADDNIGILALEEDIPKTALGIMSIEANQTLHLSREFEGTPRKSGKDLGTGLSLCLTIGFNQ